MIEQETLRRVPYGVWIAEAEGGIPSFYLAHSLNAGGLHLRAKHPPRIGGPLQMRLVVENERRVMTLRGEVVGDDEAVSAESFAVRFVHLDPDDRAFIEGLVAEVRDQAFIDELLAEARD
jgi:hypothetical protein